MSTIKAWAQTEAGKEASVLSLVDVPKPTLRPRDVLVRLRGVATNPVDGKIRGQGEGALANPLIVGWDGAGVVEEVGSEAVHFAVGDAVFFAGDITRAGCFAELVAVDERVVARKPTNVDFATSAAIPLTALTAYEGLVEVARLPSGRGKSILVVAGGGGLGSMVTQVAKNVLHFDTVVATASRPETQAWCKQHGADVVINHREDMVQQLSDAGFPNGVDVIFNCTEADSNFDILKKLIAPLGVVILVTGPFKPVELAAGDAPNFFHKRASICYELMFARLILGHQPERQGEILTKFARWVEDGTIVPHTTADNRFKIRDLPKALEVQDSGRAIGKLVVDVDAWA